VVTYEDRLARDTKWALAEGSRHFEDRSAVHDTLRRIAARLDELTIPYVVAGGMALFLHGYRRFTEDIDLVVTRDGLRGIHEALDGLGYVRVSPSGRTLRDAESGVRLKFLTTGDYPGDGRPKPVAFPDPGGGAAALERDGVRYLNLPTLIELKLASGMTNPARLRDLSDVLELIRLLNLSEPFADNLNPFVRAKFMELLNAARADQDAP
jgi:hypothetical protein